MNELPSISQVEDAFEHFRYMDKAHGFPSMHYKTALDLLTAYAEGRLIDKKEVSESMEKWYEDMAVGNLEPKWKCIHCGIETTEMHCCDECWNRINKIPKLNSKQSVLSEDVLVKIINDVLEGPIPDGVTTAEEIAKAILNHVNGGGI